MPVTIQPRSLLTRYSREKKCPHFINYPVVPSLPSSRARRACRASSMNVASVYQNINKCLAPSPSRRSLRLMWSGAPRLPSRNTSRTGDATHTNATPDRASERACRRRLHAAGVLHPVVRRLLAFAPVASTSSLFDRPRSPVCSPVSPTRSRHSSNILLALLLRRGGRVGAERVVLALPPRAPRSASLGTHRIYSLC